MAERTKADTMIQPDLFDELLQKQYPVRGMIRNDDHGTSVSAAISILPHLSDLQARVLAAFRRNEAMTDRELEKLPCFSELAPSTIRKRRGELVKADLVVDTGERRDGMIVWEAK